MELSDKDINHAIRILIRRIAAVMFSSLNQSTANPTKNPPQQ